MFDINLIKNYYISLDSKISKLSNRIAKPLTLTEKILYLHSEKFDKEYKRGLDYVNFYPDRVAMQDATAQMAILQFMMSGKEKAAVPTTVHADHLIQARTNSEFDLKNALDINSEVYDFLASVSKRGCCSL